MSHSTHLPVFCPSLYLRTKAPKLCKSTERLMPTTIAQGKTKGVKEEEKTEVAGFLLSLKHPGDEETEEMNENENEKGEVTVAVSNKLIEDKVEEEVEDSRLEESKETKEPNEQEGKVETSTQSVDTYAEASEVPIAESLPALQAVSLESVTAEAVAAAAAAAAAVTLTPSDVVAAGVISHQLPQQTEFNFEHLVAGSELVFMKDRDLVPDALFLAIAQMKPCKLTQADRVGCYKTRDIGFMGMCCKHCGGQPGFGRFFPNSVRSLAQTTTSQTMLKHIASKCRFCDPAVRNAVNELQRLQTVREGLASGRPRYGSRKIFFQRVWSRLHGSPPPNEEESYVDSTDIAHPTLSLQDEVAAAVAAEAAKISAETVAGDIKRKAAEVDSSLDESNKKSKAEEATVERTADV